jgi:hypothetical protein
MLWCVSCLDVVFGRIEILPQGTIGTSKGGPSASRPLEGLSALINILQRDCLKQVQIFDIDFKIPQVILLLFYRVRYIRTGHILPTYFSDPARYRTYPLMLDAIQPPPCYPFI